MNHIYYRIILTLESPLSIGSGLEENTDADIVLDSENRPYIPGSSLAGLYRSLLEGDEAEQKKYFGEIKPGGQKSVQSPLLIYDARCMDPAEDKVSVRDSVALDAYKTAVTNMKFDLETAETGLKFLTYIEVDKNHGANFQAGAEELIEGSILPAIQAGVLTLGRKSTRGYGRLSVDYQKRVFDLSNPNEQIKTAAMRDWLDFELFADHPWHGVPQKKPGSYQPIHGTPREVISIPLRLCGAISIRQYMTGLPEPGYDTAPDYKQLSLSGGAPVIPGTSWAGAFRGRMANMIKAAGITGLSLDSLYGYVRSGSGNSVKSARKSQIIFSETQLAGGHAKYITRNSIDRFSAATKDGALYTEQTYYCGHGTLEISLPVGKSPLRDLVYACILDLCRGFLAVGGLTAVGRGIFKLADDQKIRIGANEYDLDGLEGLIHASSGDE